MNESAQNKVSKDESMAVAEAAREEEWKNPSFVGEIFMGRFHPELLFPYPQADQEDEKEGEEFLERLRTFLKENLDPEEVDKNFEVPASVFEGLAKLGCFAMKIPKSYGGLGLSQVNYNRAVALVASYCGSTAVWLSAHQSIGVPQPLKLFGTEEQKKEYFPRFVRGEISAFALTEPDVGSDPARMTTVAEPNEDRSEWTINGEKLWCTNGLTADVMVVMARTPDKRVHGKPRRQITAFIVEGNSPGIERPYRCEFMGLHGIQNGILRFRDVKVPAKNILLAEGKGLKLALVTLNTGRLTLPAACVGQAKQSLNWLRSWCNKREQWGAPIGQHEAISQKLGWMTATTFAMEAVTYYASHLADRGGADIRLEAAMAKMFCSEASWKIADETIQVRGGRGYETARSLKARGEEAIPAERAARDARINMIIEGSSEIMRLFIAREAVDPHMRLAGDLIKPGVSFGKKAKAFLNSGLFYLSWYPRQWLDIPMPWIYKEQAGSLSGHIDYVRRTSRKLARNIFHLMLRFGPGLEKRQASLGRIVEIGTEIFAMSASVSYARSLKGKKGESALRLADLFCRQAKRRIKANFKGLWCNDDARTNKVSKQYLDGDYLWLEKGCMGD